MRLKTITSLDMGENCYIVIDEKSDDNKAIVIDPGDNAEKINRFLSMENINVQAICLTHCHFDHIGAADEVKEETGAPICICEGEEIVAENTSYNLTSMAGWPHKQQYDRVFKDGEKFAFGSLEFKVIKTPGHTPGGCCFYFENDAVLFAGDTLFFLSRGRTDFPGGSEEDLIKSIKEKLFTLPEDVHVFSGHGERTAIGFEKANNAMV
jgi:glyoxylase-like metal-dependent hydrolase (beta-lactamase superfamily II)